jgi:hypothetical protein
MGLTSNRRDIRTRPEFDTLIDGFDRERLAARARLLELHRGMIAATTDAEWNELAKRERDVLSCPAGKLSYVDRIASGLSCLSVVAGAAHGSSKATQLTR